MVERVDIVKRWWPRAIILALMVVLGVNIIVGVLTNTLPQYMSGYPPCLSVHPCPPAQHVPSNTFTPPIPLVLFVQTYPALFVSLLVISVLVAVGAKILARRTARIASPLLSTLPASVATLLALVALIVR